MQFPQVFFNLINNFFILKHSNQMKGGMLHERKKIFGQYFLSLVIIVIVGSLPIVLRKPPIKDWVLVYLFNAVTNGIIDNIITSFNIVKYPVRLFPKLFKASITFDFFTYPQFSIIN